MRLVKKYLSLILVLVITFTQVVLVSNAMGIDENIPVSRGILNEGMVLLKNENNALPLSSSDTVAVFGDAQRYIGWEENGYQIGGFGSGFPNSYVDPVGPIEALRNAADRGEINIYEPLSQCYDANIGYVPDDEMYNSAAQNADKAIMFIKRTAAEGRDGTCDRGGWLLTFEEENMLKKLTALFDSVIVIANIGTSIDTSWAKDKIDGIHIDALLISWYGGAEGGNGIADIILGKVNPSGKLADTFAEDINDYPSTEGFDNYDYAEYKEDIFVGYRYFETFNIPVSYEFGFGLSYTSFAIENVNYSSDNRNIYVSATVTNTGTVAGKEVVQVYYSAPQMGTGAAKLSKASKELAAFAKTKILQPQELQTLTLQFPIKDMASYDDTGVTGHESAYVLEAGTYGIYVGNSVKDANSRPAGEYTVSSLTVTEQLSELAAPHNLETRLLADGTYENILNEADNVTEPVKTEEPNLIYAPKETIYRLSDLAEGRCDMDDFLHQMSIEELASFAVGHAGNIGEIWCTAGGSDEVAQKYGVPRANLADGPAGLRIGSRSTGWACETLCACTWNTELIYEMGVAVGKEAVLSKAQVWCAPGMTLHRNPLGGRNFEYYSEDPFLTGVMAISVVSGVQSQGISAEIKHFACNNKEQNRNSSDSRLSERALREIYLRGFSIAVKGIKAEDYGERYSLFSQGTWCIMTSYNLINGTETSENYQLLTGIVRNEWGYTGIFTTDALNNSNIVREFLAGNTIKMPEGSTRLLIDAYNSGIINRPMLERNAEYILNFLMKLNVFTSDLADGSVLYDDANTVPTGNRNYAADMQTFSWGAGDVNYQTTGKLSYNYAQNVESSTTFFYMDGKVRDVPTGTDPRWCFGNYTPFTSDDTYVLSADYDAAEIKDAGCAFALTFREGMKVHLNGNALYLFIDNVETYYATNVKLSKGDKGNITVYTSPEYLRVWIDGNLYMSFPMQKREPQINLYVRGLDISFSEFKAFYCNPISQTVPSLGRKANLAKGMQINASGNAIDNDDGIITASLATQNTFSIAELYNFKKENFAISDEDGYYLSTDIKTALAGDEYRGVKFEFRDGYTAHLYENLVILTGPNGELLRAVKDKRIYGKTERIEMYSTPTAITLWVNGKPIIDNFTISATPVETDFKITIDHTDVEIKNICVFYDEQSLVNGIRKLIAGVPNKDELFSDSEYEIVINTMDMANDTVLNYQNGNCTADELYHSYGELHEALQNLKLAEPKTMPTGSINYGAKINTFSWGAGNVSYQNDGFIDVSYADDVTFANISYLMNDSVTKWPAEVRNAIDENYTVFHSNDTYVMGMDYDVKDYADLGCAFAMCFRKNSRVQINGNGVYLLVDNSEAVSTNNYNLVKHPKGHITLYSSPNRVTVWINGNLCIDYAMNECEPQYYLFVRGIDAKFSNLSAYSLTSENQTVPSVREETDIAQNMTAVSTMQYNCESLNYNKATVTGKTAKQNATASMSFFNAEGNNIPIKDYEGYYFSADITVSDIIEGENNGVKVDFRLGHTLHIYENVVVLTGPNAEIARFNRSSRATGKTERVDIHSMPSGVSLWIDGIKIIDRYFFTSELLAPSFGISMRQTDATVENIRIYSAAFNGDLNGDSDVNAVDLTLMKINLLQNKNVYDLKFVDMNNDNSFDIRDLIRIKKEISYLLHNF